MAKRQAPQKPQKITRDDWLSAIAEARKSEATQDPGLLSYSDFQALMGVAYGTARKHLEALLKAGRAVRATKRTITADGRVRTVVAFRLKKS